MISVKEAAQLAAEFGYEVFGKTGAIEEVELQGERWIITLGYDVTLPTNADTVTSPGSIDFLSRFGTQKTQKIYKKFTVDGEKKEVTSAKILKL